MPMNLVIQKKRKELGLTQEQVADYLNVSIPAVSKWENGSTSPDISLLPPLARLLKIDLNTLLCFQEDMTRQEINCFCQEIVTVVQAKGIAEGFETVKEKIHEYPHNETLLHCLTFQLDGLLAMSGLSHDEMQQYDDILAKWYAQLAESADSRISNSASYMMAGRFIRKGDYDKAQEILNLMPEKEDMTSSMADKRMLQVNIYMHQGKTQEAAKDLQNLLLMALNKVQMLLCKMVDVELAADNIQTAKSIADKAARMPGLFDLWEYNSYVAPLEVATAEKNAGECLRIMEQMLEAMLTPWDMGASPLFHRIAKATDTKQMLAAILPGMERDSAYDFLKDTDKFKELICKYRSFIEK